MDKSDFKRAEIGEYNNGVYEKTIEGHVREFYGDYYGETVYEVIAEPITFDEETGDVEHYEAVGYVPGTQGICGYKQKRPESEGGGEDMLTFEVLEIEY